MLENGEFTTLMGMEKMAWPWDSQAPTEDEKHRRYDGQMPALQEGLEAAGPAATALNALGRGGAAAFNTYTDAGSEAYEAAAQAVRDNLTSRQNAINAANRILRATGQPLQRDVVPGVFGLLRDAATSLHDAPADYSAMRAGGRGVLDALRGAYRISPLGKDIAARMSPYLAGRNAQALESRLTMPEALAAGGDSALGHGLLGGISMALPAMLSDPNAKKFREVRNFLPDSISETAPESLQGLMHTDIGGLGTLGSALSPMAMQGLLSKLPQEVLKDSGPVGAVLGTLAPAAAALAARWLGSQVPSSQIAKLGPAAHSSSTISAY